MAWDDGLEGPHREIAGSEDDSICVLAGPGTGKTFAMMRRVARLLEEGADPAKVLAVTFTRTATTDLKQQLQALGVAGSQQVAVATLHALSFGALSREDAFEQTERTARPLLSFETDALIADLADDFGGRQAAKDLLEAYEAGWARLQRDVPGWAPTEPEQIFETALLGWLRFHRAMLIGELVPLALRHLRSNPAVSLFEAFDHVLVDEFQDLNKSDQALVQELARAGAIMVLGDDNQSIYSFRHANPQGIREYSQEHPGTAQFLIEHCRRCPPNIVAMSNALIAHDPDGLRDVPLVADGDRAPAEVHVVQHLSLMAEVEAVADFIHWYLDDNPEVAPGQVLVLSPRRVMGQAVKRALIDRGRQALSYFYEDELDHPRAAEGFCLLTLLVRPDDRAALRGWFAIGSGSRRSRSYKRMRDYCSQNALEPRAVLDSLLDGSHTLAHTAAIQGRYESLRDQLTELDGLEGLELVDALWPADVDDVQDVRRMAQGIALDSPAPPELLGLLHQDITQPQLPGNEGDIIRVMSLHKSKGLTARVVVVVGCVAGALPTLKDDLEPAARDAHLAEQRRLFYVAITRAMDVLVLSSPATMAVADAMRAGIHHAGYVQGQRGVVRTRMTPYLAEMGDTAPAPVLGPEWRREVGF